MIFLFDVQLRNKYDDDDDDDDDDDINNIKYGRQFPTNVIEIVVT